MRNLARLLGTASLAAAGLLAAGCAADGSVGPSSTAAPGTSVVVVTSTAPATTVPTATTSTTTSTTAPTTTNTLPAVTTSTIPPTTTTTLPAWWREATAEEPLRVWVIGDSLAGPTGSALAALSRAGGLIRVRVDEERATGLARPDVRDWPAFVGEDPPTPGPDAVVVLLGANDGQAIVSPTGRLEFGTTEWDARYTVLVGGFMDELLGLSPRVYWVGPPIMAGPDYDARVRHLNAILRGQAALRLGVRYLDAYRLFQGPDGEYAADLPDENGDLVEVRTPDGIHFTPAGAQLLAQRIMEVLAAEWRLPGESGG